MSSDAADRVRRFLDARDGYFPIDVLAVVTRTGDRLLASDLRALAEALVAVRALAKEWDHDITELRDDARRNGDMAADWHADARQQHLRQLRAALDADPPFSPEALGHKPFADDGVTYCGWATDHGVIDGCGEVWPCSTVRVAALGTGCATCSGRGVWMDEPCHDCARIGEDNQ